MRSGFAVPSVMNGSEGVRSRVIEVLSFPSLLISVGSTTSSGTTSGASEPLDAKSGRFLCERTDSLQLFKQGFMVFSTCVPPQVERTALIIPHKDIDAPPS